MEFLSDIYIAPYEPWGEEGNLLLDFAREVREMMHSISPMNLRSVEQQANDICLEPGNLEDIDCSGYDFDTLDLLMPSAEEASRQRLEAVLASPAWEEIED